MGLKPPVCWGDDSRGVLEREEQEMQNSASSDGLGVLLTCRFISVGLEWGLRVCISNELLGDAQEHAGLRSQFE